MKKVETCNWRVEVCPREPGAPYVSIPWREGEEEQACRDLELQINRHVDYSVVTTRHDKQATCEFCGRIWTEDGDTYNGGCCYEDEKNNPEYCDDD